MWKTKGRETDNVRKKREWEKERKEGRKTRMKDERERHRRERHILAEKL